MTKETWTAFRKTVKHYRALIDKITVSLPDLPGQIQRLVDSRGGPSYTVGTPVVYNQALDGITADSEIKMILVGDNPGRREQENRRYLVGPSGKIAEKFFCDNPSLGIDFRKNVLILNKTPIHTPRTTELKTLCALGGKQVEEAVRYSQKAMAKLLGEFWHTLSASSGNPGRGAPRKGETSPPIIVWIIGYSEMKKGGIFEAYTETLKTLCAANDAFKENIRFFRHFSMNQFTIDLKNQAIPGENLQKRLERMGKAYRERVL